MERGLGFSGQLSTEHLKHSLLPTPDPKAEYTLDSINIHTAEAAIIELHDAYFLFKIYRRLYADLPIDIRQFKKSENLFSSDEVVDNFKVIELELGFLYDELYTKDIFCVFCCGHLSSLHQLHFHYFGIRGLLDH
ncbi:hypothetical protein L1049_021038 [Liquidambar formosana]|uniref:DUF4220 domain-containing protein n=1 Tax=Liquidambar formosana TaxID=63359 RepID=A0AAP0SCA2_LIQFO